MNATDSLDPYISTAIKLLHSSAPDSAEKLRTMLDNEIIKNHDKSKLISNLLTKKQISDEKSAPGSGFKKHKPKKPEELKVVRAPTPEIIPIIDDDSSPEKKSEAEDGDEMDYTDLTCATCGQIDSSANNQLFECVECHLLLHQLCHVPKIPNDTSVTSWICSTCKAKKEKEGSAKSTKSYESSSSSSSSSSRNKKPSVNVKSSSEKEKKVEVSKKKGKESSSSSSSSRSRSNKK